MQGLTVRRTHLGETKASGFGKPTVSGAVGPASALDGQQPETRLGRPNGPGLPSPVGRQILMRRVAVHVDVSICVMPITALAGAVPHSVWGVGASVRDLTARWHGKEQRVAVPCLPVAEEIWPPIWE
jgi:hypothetical protein